MKTRIIFKCLVTLLAFSFAGPLSAAPKVVVSLAPLHSLVSSLMVGIAEPTLLLEQDAAHDKEMDVFQKSHLLTADMVVWTGSGLEASIARTLEQMPLLNNKLITLSNYVPLLGRADASGSVESRQHSRELSFWNDPRLAIMAVRMITPRLVRLDPEHQERYLDNEIGLLKQLKGLEKEIAARLSPYDAVSQVALDAFDPYFNHRFIAPSVMVSNEIASMQKVSANGSNVCGNPKIQLEKVSPGPAYYFEAMQLAAKSLSSCMQRLEGSRTVAKQAENKNHES